QVLRALDPRTRSRDRPPHERTDPTRGGRRVTAGDLAAVVVTLLAIGAVIVLLFAAQSLLRAVRALEDAVAELRDETVPTVVEIRRAAEATQHEIERVDRVLERADVLTGRADLASRVGFVVFVNPIIKVWAAVSGTNRAARRLRGRSQAFKRVVWFGTGVAGGAAGTVWTALRLRQAGAPLTPDGPPDPAH